MSSLAVNQEANTCSPAVNEEEAREVRCNICTSTQTDDLSCEPEEWHNWVQSAIVEDDALFYSAAAEEAGTPKGMISPQHAGDEYQRSCVKCREALGLRRPHKH